MAPSACDYRKKTRCQVVENICVAFNRFSKRRCDSHRSSSIYRRNNGGGERYPLANFLLDTQYDEIMGLIRWKAFSISHFLLLFKIRSRMENFRSMQISFRPNSWEKLRRKWIAWIKPFFFPLSISGERILICYVDKFVE